MKRYGLIGFPLSHSFSAKYFAQKFETEKISGCIYENFPLEHIDQIEELMEEHPDLEGLNVTIPYKEEIIPYLDLLDKTAGAVEAVNVIKFVTDENNNRRLIGYNTDTYGFEMSLKHNLQSHHRKALVLGTGGASKAVVYVLKQLGIQYAFISRNERDGIYKTYQKLTEKDIQEHTIIVNTSPVGMSPNVNDCPAIPYEGITSKHILYDLIYNPTETLFLAKGKEKGATTLNGLEMLHFQAEKAWEIWNE